MQPRYAAAVGVTDNSGTFCDHGVVWYHLCHTSVRHCLYHTFLGCCLYCTLLLMLCVAQVHLVRDIEGKQFTDALEKYLVPRMQLTGDLLYLVFCPPPPLVAKLTDTCTLYQVPACI